MLSDAAIHFHIPLWEQDLTLQQAYDSMQEVGLQQDQVPLIVQIAENPRFELPGIEIFSGATDLRTHDYIHILLGRGLLPKDEAFVLGFTMGSTNRLGVLEQKLYELFSRYLYPSEYRFTREDFAVFKDAVRLGYISNCRPLNSVDYTALLEKPLGDARRALEIETDLLQAYYGIEAKRYAHCPESLRLSL